MASALQDHAGGAIGYWDGEGMAGAIIILT